MTHVPYLEPLVNHIKNCDVLASDCPEVIVKSKYRGIDEDNQCVPAIWIIPCESTAKSTSKAGCKTVLDHKIRICVVVRCPSSTRNHFDQSIDGTVTELLGPYVDGALLLKKLHECIEEYNCDIENVSHGQSATERFSIRQILKPDEHNGHLIHCIEYQTRIFY